MNDIIAFVVAAAVFAGIDLLWLGVIAKDFYRKELGSLFAKKIVATPAIIFYVLYVIGLIFFALHPAVDSQSAWIAVRNGAFFGLIAYGTYDLTNWATLDKWPGAKLSLVDMVWGTFLTAATTLITFLIIGV